ncbi:MAG: toll/interleukin-1 receptor domain-containing protein, partial [Marinomonas sp.]
MADLFISYSRADRPRCIQIRDALEALKLDIWFDAGIDAGDNFDRKIEQEIDAAKGVMVLWSASSVESNWVRNEARSGAEREQLVAV